MWDIEGNEMSLVRKMAAMQDPRACVDFTANLPGSEVEGPPGEMKRNSGTIPFQQVYNWNVPCSGAGYRRQRNVSD